MYTHLILFWWKSVFACCGLILSATQVSCNSLENSAHVELNANRNPVLVMEFGQLKRLYAVTIVRRFSFSEVSGLDAVLADRYLPQASAQEAKLLLKLPAWRQLEQNNSYNLLSVVQAITPPYKVPIEDEPIRWIIGSNPVVVAVGLRKLPKEEIAICRGVATINDEKVPGFTYRFVKPTDVEEKVTDLYVLDTWPPSRIKVDSGDDETLRNSLRAHVRHKHIDATLRDLFQSKLLLQQ